MSAVGCGLQIDSRASPLQGDRRAHGKYRALPCKFSTSRGSGGSVVRGVFVPGLVSAQLRYRAGRAAALLGALLVAVTSFAVLPAAKAARARPVAALTPPVSPPRRAPARIRGIGRLALTTCGACRGGRSSASRPWPSASRRWQR